MDNWEIENTTEPKPIRPSWDEPQCNSYSDYLNLVNSLKSKGFRQNPSSRKDVKKLQELVDKEIDVTIIPYYNDDGQRVDDLFLTYERPRYK